MKNVLPKINPEKEFKKIVSFLKKTFQEQKINNVVIGQSGGIDSTVCYYLLKKVIPENNIIAVHLPYFTRSDSLKYTSEVYLKSNNSVIQIKIIVDKIWKTLKIENRNLKLEIEDRDPRLEYQTSNFQPRAAGIAFGDARQNLASTLYSLSLNNKIRFGNIMSRVRMIILFDLAKKNNALVCGTENKSEHLLGYFTRFGDGASDIEPIRHLYKTQVYELAKYLEIPKEIISQKPSAGLWKNQTDEDQFGFTYQEADQVLHLYFDKKMLTEKIIKAGYPNAKKIISYVKKNEFKRKTPYSI